MQKITTFTDFPSIRFNGEKVTFEYIPSVTVKALTAYEQGVTLSTLIDKLLSANPNPSAETENTIKQIALARLAIIEPEQLVKKLLESYDGRALLFFESFFMKYSEWLQEISDQALKDLKKDLGVEEEFNSSESEVDLEVQS